MKTAEEMFEELGYKKYNSLFDGSFFYELRKDNYTTTIIFDLENREYLIYSKRYFDKVNACIKPELHKAITKKMEELKWL